MIEFAPKAQYTAIVDNWGPYYVERDAGAARRHLGEPGELGRHQGRARRDGALHQPAGRRRKATAEETEAKIIVGRRCIPSRGRS